MAAMDKEMMIDPRVSRELARRRVFLFFSVFMVIALFGFMIGDAESPLHAFDEYAIASLVIISILVIVMGWNRRSIPALRRQHNWLMLLFALALIVQLYAIMLEAGNPSDLVDDAPILLLILLVFINGIF